jgi:glucokinase
MNFIGIDIGGTKCAVSLGEETGKIVEKKSFPTAGNLAEALENIFCAAAALIDKYGKGNIAALGISCGGPLDSERGIIQSPPNLPGWDDVRIWELLEQRFSLPVYIENDANACALAEWYYGAGRGCGSMVFLTFGTGLGAGLILDGRLYRGANGLAGEAGHIRLTNEGPPGYGKRGSFEGWCSGGGLSAAYLERYGANISGGEVCIRAERGDRKALTIIEESAAMLGRGLALLIDILNPGRIVIGSIFTRSEALFRNHIEKVIREEALPQTAGVCAILASELGESLGDVAAVCAAVNGLTQNTSGFRTTSA